MSKIVAYFSETDLRKGWRGLTEQASKYGHNAETLRPGEFYCFVNTRCQSCKLLGVDGVVTYLPSNGEMLNEGDITNISTYFGASALSLRGSVRLSLRKDLGSWLRDAKTA